MDPISAISGITSLIGIGTSLFGMSGARSASNQMSATENQILGKEEDENKLRQQAMNLSADRQKIQNIRNTQTAIAMGQATAVGQGAQFGSGTAGGRGQAAAQGAWNNLGVSQNQLLGNQIFGVDFGIDELKKQLGSEQTSLSSSQGLMSLGGAIAGSSQKIGQLGATGFGMLNNMIAPDLGFS